MKYIMQGYNAFLNGRTKEQCIFLKGTYARRCWMHGYEAAQEDSK